MSIVDRVMCKLFGLAVNVSPLPPKDYVSQKTIKGANAKMMGGTKINDPYVEEFTSNNSARIREIIRNGTSGVQENKPT